MEICRYCNEEITETDYCDACGNDIHTDCLLNGVCPWCLGWIDMINDERDYDEDDI